MNRFLCSMILILLLAAAPACRRVTPNRTATANHAPSAEPLYLVIVGEPETFAGDFSPAPPTSHRQIGFSPVLYTLRTSETELARQVNAALDKAERTGYPVFFQIDDWNFPDAWNDPEMVEWTAFPRPGERLGPPVRRRWINWGSWIVANAPPNYESPRFRELVRSRLVGGIASPVAQRLRQWRLSGKEYLFAGMAVGWETGFYNLPVIDPKQRPAAGGEVFLDDEIVRTGYAALTARGYDAEAVRQLAARQGQSEEQVMYDLMLGVLHDYTEFLARACHEAGIPRERIYSHYAAARTLVEPVAGVQPSPTSATFKESPLAAALQADPKLHNLLKLNGIMVPMKTAVNPYCRPGATAAYGFCDPAGVAAEFRRAGCPEWGAVETEITENIRDESVCKAYLDELTNLGARMIGIYGWWEGGDNQFAVRQTGAPKAIRAWLAESY